MARVGHVKRERYNMLMALARGEATRGEARVGDS